MTGQIDRFEGQVAVLLVDGQERLVPRSVLSPDAREGDVVNLDDGLVDAEETQRLRAEVKGARAGLRRAKKPDAL